MNCPYDNIPMEEYDLPSEGRYGHSNRKKLCVCLVCGYEKEIVYGDKAR